MKKAILTFVLTMVVLHAPAQVALHDYLTISWKPHPIMRTLMVDATGSQERSVDLRALNGKSPAPGADWSTALALVQEYEGLGYELFSFSTYVASESGQGETWVWLMRKPKR